MVIYLVGEVARATDQEFLEEFRETTGATGGRSSALNAIGVLSKIELQPKVMDRRRELSAKIASQLKESVNTVIPVAAGARRELDRLRVNDWAGLERMVDTLRRIPPDTLDFLLDGYAFFTGYEDYGDEPIPVSPAERRELMMNGEGDEMEWGVFTTIARVAADPELDLDAVKEQLEEMTGFGPLRKILREHFVERGRILRRYRIVSDALEVLNDIKFKHVPQRRKEADRERGRLERFVSIIRQANVDLATKSEFTDFVYRHLDVDARVDELKELHAELSEEFDELHHQLMQDNKDFEALRTLEGPDHGFSDAELDELWRLLGLHGRKVEERLPPGQADADYAIERMADWQRKMERARFGSARQVVAEQAHRRYGMIYDELITE